MLQPSWSKSGGQLLFSSILKVVKPLRPHGHSVDVLEHSVDVLERDLNNVASCEGIRVSIAKAGLATCGWNVRTSQRGRKGCCEVRSPGAGRIPLECVNKFAALERELNNEQEESSSAQSDEEQVFPVDSEKET
eukprot:3127664-Amphidinium_carterae.1